MAKKIYFGDDVLKRLQAGIDDTANAVRVTLGPSGRNVTLAKTFGPPAITKDGVSVAREVEFDDVRKIGAEIAKQSSIRTAEEAGDGTTSSMVLTQAIFSHARKAVSSGMHPIFMKRGMDKGLGLALDYLRNYSAPVETAEEIAKVATLASNGDTALGDLIAQAMEMVGKDGVIAVEEGTSIETSLEFSEGMQFDRGYETRDYLLDPERADISLELPLILMADKQLTSPQDVVPAMSMAAETGRPLLIVSHGLEGHAKQIVVMNHIQGRVTSCSVKAPRIGEKRSQILENLAVLTDGMVVSDATGVQLTDDSAGTLLGGADSVNVTSQTTTFIGGNGSSGNVEEKIRQLRGRLAASGSEHDKEFYQQQISQMSGGIAVIKVGAATELELKEYKARVEDALSATQSAVQSGIVPGGGATLLEIGDYLEFLTTEEAEDSRVTFESSDEAHGYHILRKSLSEPFRRIMSNAGREPFECLYIFNEARRQDDTVVMDARTGEISNAMEAGVVDPARVVEQVLTNAVSVAGISITTACMITSSKTEDIFTEDED